jgi:hypothetical protein
VIFAGDVLSRPDGPGGINRCSEARIEDGHGGENHMACEEGTPFPGVGVVVRRAADEFDLSA